MSRMERKILNKRKNSKLSLLILAIIIITLTGLFTVDYTLRDVLALEGGKIAGWENQSDEVIIHFFGESFIIEKERVQNYVETGHLHFKEKWDWLLERINQIQSKF